MVPKVAEIRRRESSLANREFGKAEMGTVRWGLANSPFARGGGLRVKGEMA